MEWKIWVVRVIKKILDVEIESWTKCWIIIELVRRWLLIYRIATGNNRKKQKRIWFFKK